MVRVRTVEACRVRIAEQLGHVEAMALRGVPWAIGAQAIAGARRYAADGAIVNIAEAMRQGEAIEFGFSRAVENTDIYLRGVTRNHRDVGAITGQRQPKGGGRTLSLRQMADQVITVGAARPVRFSICGMERDRAMRSAKASWVSMPWREASAS